MKEKNKNVPLLILLAGLIIAVALIVVFGISNNNTNGPQNVDDPTATTGTETSYSDVKETSTTAIEVINITESETVTASAATDSETAADTTQPATTVTDTVKTTEKEKSTDTQVTTTTTSASSSATSRVDSAYSKVAFYKDKYADRYEAYGSKHSEYSAEQIVTFVNIGLDKTYYSDVKSAINKDTRHILVNKYFALSENYEPANLKRFEDKYIGSGNTGNKMVAEAVDAFQRMSDAAAAEGLSILVRSGYRSYDFQAKIYNNMINIYGQKEADTFSARPGHSEHQTGYAVDVCTKTVPYEQFDTTKEYEWAKKNIHKYGFVIHYTKDNEWITGYMDEAWHFRYIGVEEATEIYKSGLSVDEYLIRNYY